MHDVSPNELIAKVAEELKKMETIKAPEWARFAKTGVHKERAPEGKDWWYQRAAAVLRSVAVLGPIGVSKLRTKYGGKKRRGHKKAAFRRGSGSVIRKVLQQLEKAELIKFVEKGVHKGKVIAPKGASLLDKTAAAISKATPKKVVKKPEVKEEVKKEAKPKAEEKEAPKEEKAAEKKPETPKEEKKEQPKPEVKKEKTEEEKAAEEEEKTKELMKKLEKQE